MKLNNMKKEELEILSYTDLTEMLLKEEKKSLNTPSIFKKICSLLELTDDEYTSQIGDFYTSLTTDKRFVLLDNACWDLRDKHKIEINLNEEDEEDDDTEDEEDEDENVETVSSEHSESMEDEEGIDQDDDLDDLTILNEDEMEDE